MSWVSKLRMGGGKKGTGSERENIHENMFDDKKTLECIKMRNIVLMYSIYLLGILVALGLFSGGM